MVEIGCVEMDNRSRPADMHWHLNPAARQAAEAVAVHGLTANSSPNKP